MPRLLSVGIWNLKVIDYPCRTSKRSVGSGNGWILGVPYWVISWKGSLQKFPKFFQPIFFKPFPWIHDLLKNFFRIFQTNEMVTT